MTSTRRLDRGGVGGGTTRCSVARGAPAASTGRPVDGGQLGPGRAAARGRRRLTRRRRAAPPTMAHRPAAVHGDPPGPGWWVDAGHRRVRSPRSGPALTGTGLVLVPSAGEM